ncbi:MAG: P-II family nitrogen regulator [Betaproteobacteria bacterium]|nr:P-II family nitrogen regulator [Betaproteobacteria bacterium]
MKEIKAFIHKHRIAAVIEALKLADLAATGHPGGMRNINVAAVQSLLTAVDTKEQRYSMDLAEPVIEEYKLELLCVDTDAERLANVVAMSGRTGQGEAGWVYITTVESAMQIGS